MESIGGRVSSFPMTTSGDGMSVHGNAGGAPTWARESVSKYQQADVQALMVLESRSSIGIGLGGGRFRKL